MSVDPTLEATAFVDGPPKGARDLRFVAQPGGGFFATKPGVLGGGKERHLELGALVNCCHGGPGEDGTLQAALDLAGVPYTGPGAAAAALCMDKLGFGSVAMAAGLPTLPRTLVLPGAEAPIWHGADSPFIVKPRFGWLLDRHRGHQRLGRRPALRGARRPAHSPGCHRRALPRWPPSDLQVAVRSYPSLALSLFERPLRAAGARARSSPTRTSTSAARVWLALPRLPAKLAAGLEKELREAASSVAALAGARGVWRVDFLVEPDGSRGG